MNPGCRRRTSRASVWAEAGDRLVRRTGPVGPATVGLGSAAVAKEIEHDLPRSEGSPTARYYRDDREETAPLFESCRPNFYTGSLLE